MIKTILIATGILISIRLFIYMVKKVTSRPDSIIHNYESEASLLFEDISDTCADLGMKNRKREYDEMRKHYFQLKKKFIGNSHLLIQFARDFLDYSQSLRSLLLDAEIAIKAHGDESDFQHAQDMKMAMNQVEDRFGYYLKRKNDFESVNVGDDATSDSNSKNLYEIPGFLKRKRELEKVTVAERNNNESGDIWNIPNFLRKKRD